VDKSNLQGRHIAALASDGFEKVELSIPMKALRLAGAKVDVISLRHGRIRGVNLHEPASRVRVTKTLDEANPADYDGLLLPGGFINPDLLRQSARARDFVRAFDSQGKPIATLCHGPWVLASAGLLNGRTLTSWPGIRDDLVNAGATWLDQETVRDRNLLTSRGPQDMIPFVRAMLELFSVPTTVQMASSNVTTSAPQRNEPPQVVLSAMKWMPRPSFRTALSLGAVAMGFLAASKLRAAP
jgi:protease I